jgi:site-specific DNA-methyltransferase (adenine-specific)
MKPYYKSKLTTIYHGDFQEVMQELPARTCDLIVTDPPYWTLDKHRAIGTTTRLGGNYDPEKRSGWFETIQEGQVHALMDESYRLLKNNCHAYFMSDGQTLKWILPLADTCWSNCKPIVWDKVNIGMGYHYRCKHEYFVMLDKGKNRRLNSLSTPDLWRVPMVRGGYPTEKPVALMEIPIRHSTSEGELVLDPFMGGGSTLVAAARAGRRAIGIDKSEAACELAATRLSAALEPA